MNKKNNKCAYLIEVLIRPSSMHGVKTRPHRIRRRKDFQIYWSDTTRIIEVYKNRVIGGLKGYLMVWDDIWRYETRIIPVLPWSWLKPHFRTMVVWYSQQEPSIQFKDALQTAFVHNLSSHFTDQWNCQESLHNKLEGLASTIKICREESYLSSAKHFGFLQFFHGIYIPRFFFSA